MENRNENGAVIVYDEETEDRRPQLSPLINHIESKEQDREDAPEPTTEHSDVKDHERTSDRNDNTTHSLPLGIDHSQKTVVRELVSRSESAEQAGLEKDICDETDDSGDKKPVAAERITAYVKSTPMYAPQVIYTAVPLSVWDRENLPDGVTLTNDFFGEDPNRLVLSLDDHVEEIPDFMLDVLVTACEQNPDLKHGGTI